MTSESSKNSSAPLLEATGVRAGYGSFRVLDGVGFHVAPGEAITILGPNGAGKTTLFKAIIGLIPLWDGQITYDGRDLRGVSTSSRVRDGIALVPEGRRILTALTVKENLLLGAHARRDSAQIGSDIEALLTEFPILAERYNTRAGAMSGGEQQMLALARGLISRPKVLLLDEPTLGLSPLMRQKVVESLNDIHNNRGITILLVEQDAKVALSITSRYYVMRNGRMVAEGHSQNENAWDRIRDAYLGTSTETPAN